RSRRLLRRRPAPLLGPLEALVRAARTGAARRRRPLPGAPGRPVERPSALGRVNPREVSHDRRDRRPSLRHRPSSAGNAPRSRPPPPRPDTPPPAPAPPPQAPGGRRAGAPPRRWPYRRLLLLASLVAVAGAVWWRFETTPAEAPAEIVLQGNIDVRQANLAFK